MISDPYYILVGREVKVVNLHEWAQWMADTDPDDRKRVAINKHMGITVSTVFLGIDHNFHQGGPPVLFETIVFIEDPDGGAHDFAMERYCTWKEAFIGHIEMCFRVFRDDWKADALEEYNDSQFRV